jgi:predicted RNA-binding protein with PIN domain
MARVLVDGNNVMGSRPDGWWRDRHAAMQRLVNALDDLAAETGDEITVVFDGRDRGLQATRARVHFAPHADDAIAERAGAGTTVVTSDRELERRVTARGARTEGAGAFRRRIGT